MPVNITGAKYAIRPLSSAGTTTATIGTGTFVSGDFGATQRMVALFTSANAFKGIAWVRRFISTTQLELEGQFVDPITGLFATQVVGDQILVSKNFVDSAAVGVTVSAVNQTVVTTTNIIFGTSTSATSCCFYDELYDIETNDAVQTVGGVAVLGKLIGYDGTGRNSLRWSRVCQIKPMSTYNGSGAGAVSYCVVPTGGSNAHFFMFGGTVGGSFQSSNFIGAQGSGATNGSFAFFGTRLNYACASPSNGGNWGSNPDRHVLYKTIHEAKYTNANLIVWGNGVFEGEYLAFPQYGSGSPIGIFRATGATATPYGAAANNRTVVADLGTGAFIDDANNGSYEFTNTITPAVSIARHAGGTVPITMRFSDDYTNLKARTTVAVARGDGTLATSVVNTSSGTFAATVVQATYSATANGAATPTNFYTTFNYTAKCYGYQVVNGTHSTYTYSLGTAGNGTNLKLGGLINQVADTGVTLTETNALDLSSKFTINSATKRITVMENATLSELYDYAVAWGCSSAANAQVPTLSQYLLIFNGELLSTYTDWNMTINSGVTLSGDAKYKQLALTGTGILTNNGTISVPYRDADGLRVTVTNLDPEDFGITWFLRHRPTGGSTWTNVSGTGNTALILLSEGSYDVQVRAPGYEWESALTLDTDISLSLNAGLRYHVSANNTPQYEMAFDDTLSNIFQFDPAAEKVSVANSTSGILTPGFAELYQSTQRIQHLSSLVWTWVSPVTANATSQKILIPSGNPISMFLTDASTNTVKITCPVIHADTGSSADDRVRGNASGYSIILGSPATAESAGLASQIISGLGGPNYDAADHSLSVIKSDQDLAKAVLDLVQIAVDAVKAKTDNLPAAPAAVGDAMTLTGAYDAAKTAASQASVDALLEVTAPTPAQIRAEMETPGSKLDKAMKAAQSAEDQTA